MDSTCFHCRIIIKNRGQALLKILESPKIDGPPLSVDPRNWYPLRRGLDAFNRILQRHYRLVDVVVDNCEVEIVSVSLSQHVGFAS